MGRPDELGGLVAGLLVTVLADVAHAELDQLADERGRVELGDGDGGDVVDGSPRLRCGVGDGDPQGVEAFGERGIRHRESLRPAVLFQEVGDVDVLAVVGERRVGDDLLDDAGVGAPDRRLDELLDVELAVEGVGEPSG